MKKKSMKREKTGEDRSSTYTMHTAIILRQPYSNCLLALELLWMLVMF